LSAKRDLGEPYSQAGLPEIQELPNECRPYVAELQEKQWFKLALRNGHLPRDFAIKLIEIDPLLSIQTTINTAVLNRYRSALSDWQSINQVLSICLPLEWTMERWIHNRGPNSLLIRSSSLSVRQTKAGLFETEAGVVAGILIGSTIPLIHVVRFNGRCYMRNGYHRALAARLAGTRLVPCIFREARDSQSIGVDPEGELSMAILESSAPPTLWHFSSGKAHPVRLRRAVRVIHLSWAEHALWAE
jgi:hypothetical protein